MSAAPPPTPPIGSPLAFDVATARVLWRRDLVRFARQRSRLIGALLQPLVFWLLIGGGLAPSFRLPGAPEVGYLAYFFPGIVVMMVLFAAIFGTITVIEDRHEGFLQGVLAGPGSRLAVVVGKCAGVATVGLLQAAGFLALCPLAGFPYAAVNWPLLAALLIPGALGMAAVGFALAWWIDSSPGYHAIMSVVLLPAWVLSGAMYPVNPDMPVLGWLWRLDPMSYLVSGVRRAFYPGGVPEGTVLSGGLGLDLGVVLGTTALAFGLSAWLCARRR